MDPSLVNISLIPQDVRRRLLEYVLAKGVRPSDLGYDRTYIYRVRKGLRPVTDELLRAVLKYLTVDEYVEVVGEKPPVEEATVNDIIKVISKALRDPEFRKILITYLERYLGDYIRACSSTYTVSEEDIEYFVKVLRSEGRSEKTIREHLRYLRRALSDLDFTLSPEPVEDGFNLLEG
ncbi:MAG: hypothetical protein DRJ40_08610 [Thermoprotei archaeon]|nr:MAG: hypothetical protein DRJ40_08610 [Thermoprotei archaeon]